MKEWMAPNIPLTIVAFTALAVVVLRAAARRPEPGRSPSTKPAPALPGPPADAAGRAQHIFHELHPQGRNTLCTVCDGQYRAA